MILHRLKSCSSHSTLAIYSYSSFASLITPIFMLLLNCRSAFAQSIGGAGGSDLFDLIMLGVNGATQAAAVGTQGSKMSASQGLGIVNLLGNLQRQPLTLFGKNINPGAPQHPPPGRGLLAQILTPQSQKNQGKRGLFGIPDNKSLSLFGTDPAASTIAGTSAAILGGLTGGLLAGGGGDPMAAAFAGGLGGIPGFGSGFGGNGHRLSQQQTNLFGIPGILGTPSIQGLPNIPGLQGVPNVPGVAGSLPGVGGCLPRGTPLVDPRSPSFLQDILRAVPGASDLFASFKSAVDVDPQKLLGKWYWVVSTPPEHNRFCSTSEFTSNNQGMNDSMNWFGVRETYNSRSPSGPLGSTFGYGFVTGDKVAVYSQDSPCPNQIVATGPVHEASGQYEWLVLSNWSQYPVVGLARDLNTFYNSHQAKMENYLREEGFMNFITDSVGSVAFADWTFCRERPKDKNIAMDIVNAVLFGRA